MNSTSQCPICSGSVTLAVGTEVSEIITCKDCSNRLVVKKITEKHVHLEEAPEVEEDWGE